MKTNLRYPDLSSDAVFYFGWDGCIAPLDSWLRRILQNVNEVHCDEIGYGNLK